MASIFTDYIRYLNAVGEPPTAESFEALLDTLRGALVHEMKRRSVWSAPPSYLGVYGGSFWSEGDLLEDLVLDCYRFIFLDRLAGLRRQMRVRSNLDGLIFLNIRHFLHDLQRRHDPLGRRIFEITRAALERLIAAGRLHVLEGDPRLRNDTVLAFAKWRDVREARDAELGPWVTTWCGDLAVDLLTAWGRDEVVVKLAERVASLVEVGITVFRFGDLLDPLKREIRSRWSTFQAEGESLAVETTAEGTQVVRLVRPDRGVEERQSFAKLIACVGERLDGVGERARTKDYLRRLWLYLRQWAAEPGTDPGEAEVAPPLPSDRKIGDLLKIPRGRIPQLKASLGELVERCREALAGARQAPARGVEDLRRATGEAAAAAEEALAEQARTPPSPGEIYLLTDVEAVPVEWLVVEADEERQYLRVTVVDDAPLVGSGDVEVIREGGEASRVRCRVETRIDGVRFRSEERSGTLVAEELERVRGRLAEIARGEVRASSDAVDVDGDSEYRAWIDELEAAVAELEVAEPDVQADVVPFPASRRDASPTRRVAVWRAAAAVFALAALGLTIEVFRIRSGIDGPYLLATAQAPDLYIDVNDRGTPVTLRLGTNDPSIYLDFTSASRHERYLVELRDVDGNVLWSEDLPLVQDERLLVLPRRWLTAETYRLLIFGGDDPEPLEDRILRIEHAETL